MSRSNTPVQRSETPPFDAALHEAITLHLLAREKSAKWQLTYGKLNAAVPFVESKFNQWFVGKGINPLVCLAEHSKLLVQHINESFDAIAPLSLAACKTRENVNIDELKVLQENAEKKLSATVTFFKLDPEAIVVQIIEAKNRDLVALRAAQADFKTQLGEVADALQFTSVFTKLTQCNKDIVKLKAEVVPLSQSFEAFKEDRQRQRQRQSGPAAFFQPRRAHPTTPSPKSLTLLSDD